MIIRDYIKKILHSFKTLWGIRHLRWLWYATAFDMYWTQSGKYIDPPVVKDQAHKELQDIWDGGS
ncbi:MAG TPA: hypothetical protein ENH82_15090 [bacterium]|nr:hypothetical protein [bacterium]